MPRISMTRRTLLRGTGAAIGLPWMEGMTEAMAAPKNGEKPPVRMAAMYMPNGVREDMWTPEGDKRDFRLSPTLTRTHPRTSDGQP